LGGFISPFAFVLSGDGAMVVCCAMASVSELAKDKTPDADIAEGE
jgi:hypothetical protein